MIRVIGPTRFAKTLALTFWLSVFAAVSLGETVQDAPWFSRQVGQGVEWKHYQFEDLYGHRQSVSLIIADLDVPGVLVRIPYLESSRQKSSVMIPDQFPNAVAGVNGGFFDTSSGGGGSTTYLRINNVVITDNDSSDYPLAGAITVESDEQVRVQKRPSGGWDGVTNRRDILAQGPLLLRNTSRQGDDFNFCTARHPRTFIGKTLDNHLILATVDGRTQQSDGMTCEEMQTLMLDLGCDDATNMDGGGSTTMWVAGEANDGIVNYPSDNGQYDHLGERSVSNCIAIIANDAPAANVDARLADVSYVRTMQENTSQEVVVSYTNIGTTTWTPATVTINVTRPRTRVSPFYDVSWLTTTTPARLEEASVPPGSVGTFRFIMNAPDVSNGTIFGETFGLIHSATGIFGPADNEPRMEFFVLPPDVPATGQVIIESREGGQHFAWYDETVGTWAIVGNDCLAPGLTPGIGQTYASTFRSVVGFKRARYTPNFAQGGAYEVDIAYGSPGIYARDGVSYTVAHAGGSTEVLVDQIQNANTWVSLGQYTFNAGTGGYVEISNQSIDVSGNMYSAAARFTPVGSTSVEDWALYR